MFNETHTRKSDHIQICLQQEVDGHQSTGFERYRFLHNALPEINFEQIDISSSFLGKPTHTPFLVSSMTGGTEQAWNINQTLGRVAEAKGWAIAVGSARAAIEQPELAYSFNVRKVAPSVPIIANIGAVQLNYGYGIEQCRKAVEWVGADALVLHLNSMQEVFQPEGDTNFQGLLHKIEQICRQLDVPVGIKEVGWGIDGETALRLHEAGARFIDVAGAGGTSWSQVEKHRQLDQTLQSAAAVFADWGIPTAQCLVEVSNRLPHSLLIASGGLRSGMDSAKAIALGAHFAGFGKALLGAAVLSEEALERQFNQIELELRITMFGIGVTNLLQLKNTNRLVKLS